MNLFVANWKMNMTRGETRLYAFELGELLGDRVLSVELVIAPPFTALHEAKDAVNRRWSLAAQNVASEFEGAYTGEVSARMLADAGCRYVIVGHSERRQLFGETDETVRRRAEAALEAGLHVIACVGETEAEREAGETEAVLERQLAGIPPHERLVIAYEPVWAIGTGKSATPEIAQDAHAFVKSLHDAPVLYGGSVKPENAATLLALPDVDGALVGGASLDLQSFDAICRAGAETA
jgi:triosephosphate isomerase